MKNIKKVLASALLCGICACSALPVYAAETEQELPDNGVQVETSIIGDGNSRGVSWGEGKLIHANPWGRKPYAYAKSSTYKGKAYRIGALTRCISNNRVDSTAWAINANASSVTSATIIARTEKNVQFNGEHKIQDTYNSGWKFGTTQANYK